MGLISDGIAWASMLVVLMGVLVADILLVRVVTMWATGIAWAALVSLWRVILMGLMVLSVGIAWAAMLVLVAWAVILSVLMGVLVVVSGAVILVGAMGVLVVVAWALEDKYVCMMEFGFAGLVGRVCGLSTGCVSDENSDVSMAFEVDGC